MPLVKQVGGMEDLACGSDRYVVAQDGHLLLRCRQAHEHRHASRVASRRRRLDISQGISGNG